MIDYPFGLPRRGRVLQVKTDLEKRVQAFCDSLKNLVVSLELV